MADGEWQRAVLAEIGAPAAGLVTPGSPAPLAAAAPAVSPATGPVPASGPVHPSAPPSYWAGPREPAQAQAVQAQPQAVQAPAVQAPAVSGGAPQRVDPNATIMDFTAAFAQESGPQASEPERRTFSEPAAEASSAIWYAEPAPSVPPAIGQPAIGQPAIGQPGTEQPPLDYVQQPLGAPPAFPAQAAQAAQVAQVDGVPAGMPDAFAMSAPPAPPEPADALVRKNAHGDPLMRRLGSGMRKAVGGGAAAEAREQAESHDRIIRPVSTCRQIAVVSVRGGAGKTTIAALTATAIADIRGDRVLAVDADPALGSLALRLGVRAEHTMHELASATPRNWEETATFLARSRENLWVLPGSLAGRMTAEIELDTFRAAFGSLSRYFSTAMIDCGAGVLGALQRGILETSHAQLLVTPGTVDGAISARGALDWFAANGNVALLQRTVIVLVTHTPHTDADLDRVRDMLGGGGLPVIYLPYDRHVAAGTSIDASRVAAATRSAATRIAAEVFTRSAGG